MAVFSGSVKTAKIQRQEDTATTAETAIAAEIATVTGKAAKCDISVAAETAVAVAAE